MEEQTPAGEAAITDEKLGNFDFGPAGATKLPRETEEAAPPAAEAEAQPEPSQPEEDDGESRMTRLRDGTEISIRDLKRSYRPNWETEQRDFDELRRQFNQAAQGASQKWSTLNQQEQWLNTALNNVIAVAQAKLPQPPPPELQRTDLLAYLEQKAAYDTAVGELQELGAKQQQLHAHAAQRQQAYVQQHIQRQQQSLMAVRPELRDPVKAQKFWGEVNQYGVSMGYRPEEIQRIDDHRILLVVSDAMNWRKHVEAQARLKDKERAAQPMAPPVQEPSRRMSSAEREARGAREQLSKLRKSGSAADAEAFLSRFE